MIRATLVLIALVLSAPAWAQPAPVPSPAPTPAPDASDGEEVLTPTKFDPDTACRKQPIKTPDANVNLTTFNDFEIVGDLVDPADHVRKVLAPTMQSHNVLTDDMREQVRQAAGDIGYHVVGLSTKDTPSGVHAILYLAPLPIVRKVDVQIPQKLFSWSVFATPLFEDAVKRRMRYRPGSYLPWDPIARNCEREEETKRVESFLQDEGFFDAKATIAPKIDGAEAVLIVRVELGTAYTVPVDKISVPNVQRLPVDLATIRAFFKPHRTCLIRQWSPLCYGTPRFRKEDHAQDIQEVIQEFHRRQYPSVRVTAETFPNHRTHQVEIRVRIEPRRRVQVIFEGDDLTVSEESLRKQLTFDQAQSADDVEATNSSRAIASYLQSRGYFDAAVTWRREQFQDANLDIIIYRISQGRTRTVRAVRFSGQLATDNSSALSTDKLLDAIATKPVGRTAKLLGARSTATSATLAADVERLRTLYVREGYRDARVSVSAATDLDALGSTALSVGMLGTERGGDLFVQFEIDAGLPTLIRKIQIELSAKGDEITSDEDRTLCTQVLKDLAVIYGYPQLAIQPDSKHCAAVAANLRYREVQIEDSKDVVKNQLFARGRPRTEVSLEPVQMSAHSFTLRYKLRNTQLLKVGAIVLRGNFRTRPSIILGELQKAGFQSGKLLTAGAIAEGTRQLRNTALFDSVNIKPLGLESTTSGALNAVVEVTERYDYKMGLDLEVGGSSFNGLFVKLLPTFKNLFGIGMSLDTAVTVGADAGDLLKRGDFTLKQFALEGTLRIPQWLTRRSHIPLISFLEPQVEVTGFHRQQDTPRFGELKTTGVTTTLSRTATRPHIGSQPARALTGGFHYDYRSRERNVDVLRPVGADNDDSQVPITTITGSVGLFAEWEQRVDRSGSLQPLAPEDGFRLEAEVSFAHPLLSLNYGQDTFIKASAVGSRYWPIGNNLVLRADLRYDHGIPLGGAALLPEVERFFGGGDSTVRGYEDDRLATEIVQVPVPPLDNITQIRVLPAGGNIRVLGSLDAQLRIYKLLSTALFADAGVITNQWSTVTVDDIRPSVGMALLRIVTPFGAFAAERAVPLRPRLGDDPRGRWHISFAARAQF